MIWGQPCYYWVVPSLNTIISIKFDRSLTDAQMFEDYVKACIGYRVTHPNLKREMTEHGYVRFSYESTNGSKYGYRFAMNLHSLATNSAEMVALAKSVTHLVRRETVKVNSQDEKAEWLKLFNKLPFMKTKPKSRNRRVEVSIEARPTVKELKQIIEEESVQKKTSDWNNVGFKLEDGTTTWADRYRLKESLIVTQNVKSVYRAEELYELISRNRNQYLAKIKQAVSHERGTSLTGT